MSTLSEVLHLYVQERCDYGVCAWGDTSVLNQVSQKLCFAWLELSADIDLCLKRVRF
jgi:hypothetical protein